VSQGLSGISAPEKCQRCGQKVAVWVLIGNLSLGIVKVIAALLSGSVGVLVDGFHSLADACGSTCVLGSIKIAERPRDTSHPYGHGKAEFLASLIVYTALVCIGLLFLYESGEVLIKGRNDAPNMLALIVALLSVAGNYLMCRFDFCAASRLGSPALKADGYENLTDACSSVTVALGVVAAQLGYYFADALAGVLVSLFILFNAGHQWWGSLNQLIDRAAPPEARRRIRAMALAVAGVIGTGTIRTRHVGRNVWVDMDIVVSPECSVEMASHIADEVRGQLLRRTKNVEDVVVHYRANGRHPAARP
jgi:cation diffusion facilitator family transporter